MAARLIGESGESFLFAFDVTEKTLKIKFGEKTIPFRIGFVYIKRDDKEERYCNNSTGSILSHSPYWDDPTTEFSTEEIERIVNLPPLNGLGEPMTAEELEWNHQEFPH